MAGLLRKILPVVQLIHKEEDGDGVDERNNTEYSFAMEYSGPPVCYDIPQAVPVNVNQIPIAATIASGSLLSDFSLPIIQPIIKSNPSKKKQSKEPKSGSDAAVCIGTNEVSNSTVVSCESSDKAINLDTEGCAKGDECNPELSQGAGNSGSLGFRDGCDSSHELSGRLKVLELPDHSDKIAGGDLQDYMNSTDHEPKESDLSSGFTSSEIFSCKEEDCVRTTPCHVKRPSAVTFCDPESNSLVQEESDLSDSENSVSVRPKAVRLGKKGTCYWCLKGNRFTVKEACIVCGAKYCYSCVIRAMGSMPEGRKCVTCIGQRIDEARRRTLGKCSRMLKQLLSELEVKHIMRCERVCEVNQLPPDLIYVNGQCLSQRELLLLQTSPNPPRKLKPGYYWYDKVSGFWGKEGNKPCQIISPELAVGGHIQRDASNGNTDIVINNRKITKAELLMLQFAGVKCEGATSLWLSADGNYQEEGMNNVKGNIWKNNRVKLICRVMSLPTPPDSVSSTGEEMNSVIRGNLEQKTHKLLLVGYKKSGTSTIFKQAKLVYNVPFSEDERQNIKLMIQSNLYGYIGILLEGREQFEEETLIERGRRCIDQCSTSDNTGQIDNKTIYSIGPRLKAFSDWLLKIMVSGNLESIVPAATREYAPFVEDLWKDPAIQATYSRRSELEMLPDVANYFLERAVEIARTDFEPSDMDILYAEGITSSKGLSCTEFSFPDSTQDICEHSGYEHNPSLRYQLIRAHSRILGGGCKWLEMFEDVDTVLFCVSLTDYDEFFKESNGVATNKMLASKQLFESIVTHPTLEEKKFLLLLNKYDLLEEKINQVPLSRCEWFHDFNPVIGNNSTSNRATNPSLAHRAFQYIAVKFKRLFHSLTDKKLYVSLVTGFKPDSVDEALRYAREILNWDEEEFSLPTNEMSSTSIDASSSS